MKYLFWILIGIVCGAALGFIGPFGMYLWISWTEGERANGIGTPLSLLTLLTVPGGALVGAYAGAQRAAHGNWAGVFSASRRRDSWCVGEARPARKSVRQLEAELQAIPVERASLAKREYLENLRAESESLELNYWLVGMLALLGVLFLPFLLVSLLVVVRHLWLKHAMQDRIRQVEGMWTEGSVA